MQKKPLIIIAAFITAFIAGEIITGGLLGFPKYGVESKMKGMRSSQGHQNLYKPYSEYWNAKGKFEIYKRNNLGLPGIDVDTGLNRKYVCVLGSSFIENNYVKPEYMSTSVFQNLLKNQDKLYNVLNLGYNGYDSYDSYRRIAYFEEFYRPECIILVINSYISDSYKLEKSPFDLNRESFTKDNSFNSKLNLAVRNNSSLLRLLITLIQGSNTEQTAEPLPELFDANNVDLTDLDICLMQFYKKYKDKFICVSIIKNDTVNKRIDAFCRLNNIKFEFSNLMTPENQIQGDWHLNEKGNSELGKFLFDVYYKHYISQK